VSVNDAFFDELDYLISKESPTTRSFMLLASTDQSARQEAERVRAQGQEVKRKIDKRVQDLKSIATKRGTSEERSISFDEKAAKFNDTVEWMIRHATAQADLMKQMARLLDQHVPDWRERVIFPDMPPPE
jgi:hypothetical protein